MISGYDASSHRYWRELLEQHLTEYQWTQIALPDRYFYWRARGNALSLAYTKQAELNQTYDLIIVTSMVDLSALRGFCPHLAAVPTIVYFHENQFAYPVAESSNLVNIQLLSIYSALCADQILFNSVYNKTTYIEGVQSLLTRLPDEIPKDIDNQLLSKSSVLAVPLAPDVAIVKRSKYLAEKVQIVWNHRWEFDKQPEVFFAALSQLKNAGYAFKLHILGQSFRKQPDIFLQASEEFTNEILTYGHQTRPDYLAILTEADIVVSSSLHEFQGISMLEAIASGCTPIAPDRLVYPEYIPKQLHYTTNNEAHTEVTSLCSKLQQVIDNGERQVPDVSRYECSEVISGYRAVIEGLL
ncbi:MAG: DUF3524 domain-containing protein [Gammaproteobacteria bacterium]|nr:DUF3524 domain-containing protein [Gammaproteobacteria bacterium]NNJ72405.1 DUF3524 domain-containing protein [Enterobacterales bacterium]